METDRDIPRISEVLYVGLCYIIGTPTQVKIRRDVQDTVEMISNSEDISDQRSVSMLSGSAREGFRLATSDIDYMHWSSDDTVICDLSQIPPYHPKQTVILMECHDTPPGFAKLQLLTPVNKFSTRQSCVSVNDKVYISSSLYRKVMLSLTKIFPICESAIQHGPCASGIYGRYEYDSACCFLCKHWPVPAYDWKERCQTHGWPSPQILLDIINDGCHLVAIGSGRSTSPQQCDTEWRVSFSQAEYKLVSSMNHTQFLCYGLLKIFLNEVLNAGLDNPLLCSYFMKTTLFWNIKENTISVWCPRNILRCVWKCFKYLIQCVYKGVCPNFFIPQNNMFINKIHGAAQKELFLYLMTLYNMGFSCLLLSPSLYQIFTKAILNPQLQVSTIEKNIISEIALDTELFTEIVRKGGFVICNFDTSLKCIMKIDNLYKKNLSYSQNHIAVLHAVRNTLLVRIAFSLDKSRDDNNMQSTDNCNPLEMLISAAESGCISDALYVAMYLYNKSRYTEALYYVEITKQKLTQPYVLYSSTGIVYFEMYMEVVRGKSVTDKIREVMSNVVYIDQICCIDELRLEVCVSQQNCAPFIRVPPEVMTHMLSFLCYHHLGARPGSRQSLGDLRILLYQKEKQYIQFESGDISWQILGICEQIYGDKERALYSYQQSNIRFPFNQINPASWIRIQNIISK